MDPSDKCIHLNLLYVLSLVSMLTTFERTLMLCQFLCMCGDDLSDATKSPLPVYRNVSTVVDSR